MIYKTIHRKLRSSNMNPTKNWWWTQVLTYLEGIFNTWNRKTRQMSQYYSFGIHKLFRLLLVKFISETARDRWNMLNVEFLAPFWNKILSLFSQIFSRKKMPNGAKKGVSMYMGMNNLLFICFLWCFFFNVFLAKCWISGPFLK
jgi:hypothetical protein